MSFLRPIQWYHSKADPFWPDGTFKVKLLRNFVPPKFMEFRGGALFSSAVNPLEKVAYHCA